MKTTEQLYGAHVTEEQEELPAGFVIEGRYAIDGFLARGGFATVYRAHHVQIERSVAIKVLEPPQRRTSSKDFAQRFLQEAKIAAQISHPGVVDVFDFGMLPDGRAFIVMDLLVGHDLERELEQNGPMKASRIVPMIAECLAALQDGHDQGIVHKDLKPSNLFLVRPGSPQERLVILDFGIARVFADPGARVTQEGGFSGTPAYLAPEYIRTQEVSPAIDVYQMGLILLEALTGAPAVQADSSMGYLLAHCLHPIMLPTVLHDTDLGHVCLKAVAKDPALRWPDAGSFREALLGISRLDLFDTEPLESVDAGRSNHANDTVVDLQAKTLQFIDVSPEQFKTALDDAAPDGFAQMLRMEETRRPAAPTQTLSAGESSADSDEDTSNRALIWLAFGLIVLVLLAGVALLQLSKTTPEGEDASIEMTGDAPEVQRAAAGVTTEPEPSPSDPVPDEQELGTEVIEPEPAEPVEIAADLPDEQAKVEEEPEEARAPRARPETKKVVRRKKPAADSTQKSEPTKPAQTNARPADGEEAAARPAKPDIEKEESEPEDSSPMLLSP